MNKISHDSETPAQGQQVITVCAFIYKMVDNVPKVFLARRAATKKFLPGMLELPGGHVDFGEDLIPALKREIQEEFEVNVEVSDIFDAFTYMNEIKGAHAVELIYFAQFTSPEEQIKLHPEDHSEYVWLTREEVVARASDLIATEHVEHNLAPGDDPEYQAILHGFDLLAPQN